MTAQQPIPCPFCDKLPVALTVNNAARVECQNVPCDATVIVHAPGYDNTKQGAITRWNAALDRRTELAMYRFTYGRLAAYPAEEPNT